MLMRRLVGEDDLSSFDIGSYVHIETRTNEWDMNWKLFFDTFAESYHIRVAQHSCPYVQL